MNTDFVFYLFVTTTAIWGFHILFQDGHFLEGLAKWFVEGETEDRYYGPNKRRAMIAKPLFDCPICMSSLHGILWFFIGLPLFFNDALSIRLLIPFLLCLCGINTIISKLTTKERVIVDE